MIAAIDDAWRPWEPCIENVALGVYYTWYETQTKAHAYWMNGALFIDARTRPSAAKQRGTEVHRHIERNLRGHRADQVIFDDCIDYKVPDFVKWPRKLSPEKL